MTLGKVNKCIENVDMSSQKVNYSVKHCEIPLQDQFRLLKAVLGGKLQLHWIAVAELVFGVSYGRKEID